MKKRKSLPITGCYLFKLSEEMWDKMNFSQKCNEMRSLPYSSEVIMKWAKLSWSELKRGQRQRVVGVLRGSVYLFADNKFGGTKAIDRRVELCPTSLRYEELRYKLK